MNRDETVSKIFDVIEVALARAGFRIIDGDDDSIVIRVPEEDRDFKIKVKEFAE